MKILHTIAGAWRHTGGPAVSVSGLCVSLARKSADVVLLTGEGPTAAEVGASSGAITVRTEALGPYWAGHFSPAFGRACREEAAQADLIHTHGLWLHPNRVSASAGRRLGKPVVFSPRGMLSEWALKRSALRKRVSWAVHQRNDLQTSSFVHVTSEDEGRQVHAAGIEAPVAVVENGVALETFAGVESVGQSKGRPTVLFLSRIHPVKGLDLLMRAWKVGKFGVEARLVIAGQGEPGHVAQLRQQIAGIDDGSVRYVGHAEGPDKLELLAEADLMVLPSYSESYGMAVAEALASARPVITTTATPWSSLAENACGWHIEPDADALGVALREALEMSPSARAAMGLRGRELVERKHSVDSAGAKMLAAYEWALNIGPQPSFVHFA